MYMTLAWEVVPFYGACLQYSTSLNVAPALDSPVVNLKPDHNKPRA